MTRTTNPIWTDANLDIFRQMAADGKSSGEIAKHFGVTRNTICGKASRVGIQLISQPPTRKKNATNSPSANGPCKLGNLIKKIKEGRFEARVIPTPAKPCGGTHLFQLTPWHCHFPSWGDMEATNLTYCGATISYGQVYCREHKQRMTGR